MGRQFALFYLTVLTLVMGAALAYGFIVGDFWEDGGELVDNPWGIVSLFGITSAFSSSSAGSCIGKVVGDHTGLVGCDSLGRQRGQRVVCGDSPVARQGRPQSLFLGPRKTQLFQGNGKA